MERRNFVSVVPAAKKSKLGPNFFQNICVIYKLSVKKQKTGQKTGKNPPKKEFFPAPPASWLSLAGYGHVEIRPGRIWKSISSQTGSGHAHILPGWIWSCLYPAGQAGSGHVHIRPNSASWPEVLEKKHLFWRVFVGFSSCFLLFHRQFVYDTDILKKNRT